MRNHLRKRSMVARLRAADPLGPDVWPGPREGLDDLLAAVRVEALAADEGGSGTRGTGTPRARPRRRVATALAVLGILATGAATAATWVATRTGETLPPGDVHRGGPGEVLRLDGTDLAAVAAEITADIRFAPGYEDARALTLSRVFRPAEADDRITAGAARADVAQFAACSWIDYWARRRAAGDGPDVDAALRALAGLLDSSAVRDVDPRPSLQGYVGDQGTWVPTPFGGLVEILAAARAGDPAGVREAVAAAGLCGPDDVPALGRGGR